VDVEHLVGHAVPVEDAVGHRAGRADHAEHDVAVEVQGDPPGDDVTGDRDAAGLGQVMPVRTVVGCFEVHPRDELDLVGLCRRHEVVQQR